MKKAILAMCVVGLTVACNKKNDDKSPEAAPAPTNTDKTGTGGDTAPTGPVGTRLSINQKVKFVSLGQGVGENNEFKEKCLKDANEGKEANDGKESKDGKSAKSGTQGYDSAQVTYKLRKDGNTIIAEMVALTSEQTLQNPEVNSKGKSADEKEFASKCGTQAVMKMYSGVRVSQSYQVSKEQAAKIQAFEMKATPEMRSQEFMDRVANALTPSQTEDSKGGKGDEGSKGAQMPKGSAIKVEGLSGGNSALKNSKTVADAMDEAKKLAGAYAKPGDKLEDGNQIEVDAYPYSAEMKAKAISPKAEDKGGKAEDGKQGDDTSPKGDNSAPKADDGKGQPADESKK